MLGRELLGRPYELTRGSDDGITGLSIWAVDLWRTMSTEWSLRVVLGDGIAAHSKVFDVITRYPETEEVFLRYGFSLITNPAARRVFARSVSLEQACRLQGVPLNEFVAALQAKSRTAIASAPADNGQLVAI